MPSWRYCEVRETIYTIEISTDQYRYEYQLFLETHASTRMETTVLAENKSDNLAYVRDYHALSALLYSLGDDGWEMVNSYAVVQDDKRFFLTDIITQSTTLVVYTVETRYVFKRAE